MVDYKCVKCGRWDVYEYIDSIHIKQVCDSCLNKLSTAKTRSKVYTVTLNEEQRRAMADLLNAAAYEFKNRVEEDVYGNEELDSLAEKCKLLAEIWEPVFPGEKLRWQGYANAFLEARKVN